MQPMNSVGTALPRFPHQDFQRVRDLVYFDGPLVSEFASHGRRFIASWVDCDATANRWLVVRVDENLLLRYLYRKLPLRSVIAEGIDSSVLVVDWDGQGQLARVAIEEVSRLPPSYLPSNDSFFDPEMSPIASDAQSFGVLLDGDWDLSDITSFPRLFGDLYTFQYLVGQGPGRIKGSEPLRFADMNGGWVVRHLFDVMQKQLPSEDRPAVDAVQKSSPGFMRLRVNPQAATAALDAFYKFRLEYSEIMRLRDALRTEIGVIQRERAEYEDGSDESIPKLDTKRINEAFEQLVDALGISQKHSAFVDAFGSIERAATFLLSYVSVLGRLHAFVNKGFATLPPPTF
jgi:hypothetical protein